MKSLCVQFENGRNASREGAIVSAVLRLPWLPGVLCLLLFNPPRAAAGLSEAEAEARQLVREILQQRPVENSSVSGTFSVRSKRERVEIPVRFEVIVGPTNWQSVYEVTGFTNSAPPQKLVVTRDGANANRYEINGEIISPGETAVPFAGTDFWLMDLGLEFFHWPQQRVVKKEFRSNCACTVIESTNPGPSPGGYSRVTTWIDQESLGIVHAEARDVNGKLLKVFDPKSLKKIRGQYEVEEIQIKNLQTGSRTLLEFDLK